MTGRPPNGSNGANGHSNGHAVPWSEGAEKSVLGWVILRSSRGDKNPFLGLDGLTRDHFFDEKNRAVYEAARALHREGKLVSLVALEALLEGDGVLHAVGGLSRLSDLVSATDQQREDVVELAVAELRDLAMRRRVAQCLQEAAQHVQTGVELGVALQHARTTIDDAAHASSTADATTYGSSVVELLGDDEPEDDGAEQLVAGILPAESPAAIAGPPKSNKTLVALDMAICIATGEPWLGQFETNTGRVLLLLHEDTQRETRRRLWRLCRGHGFDPRALESCVRVDVVNTFRFDDPVHVDRMRRTLDASRPSLVVLDSLSRMHSADENSKRDMGVVTVAWGDLCRAYRTTVAVVHHYNKLGEGGPGARMRGSSDLFALVRGVVGVDRVKDEAGLRTVAVEGNLEHHAEPFTFEVEDMITTRGKKAMTLAFRGTADEQKQSQLEKRVLEVLVDGPLTVRDLRKVVHARFAATQDAIQQLAGRQAIDKTVEGKWRLWPTPDGLPPVPNGHSRAPTKKEFE